LGSLGCSAELDGVDGVDGKRKTLALWLASTARPERAVAAMVVRSLMFIGSQLCDAMRGVGQVQLLTRFDMDDKAASSC